MAEAGRRPGGLTALAVINFVAGAFTALGILGHVEALARPEKRPPGSPTWAIVAMIPLAGVVAILLVVSGIAYLRLKRSGRWLGTLYAAVAAGSAAFGLFAAGMMNFGVIVNLVYPVLTVILLHTTFRDDLDPRGHGPVAAAPEAHHALTARPTQPHTAPRHILLIAAYAWRFAFRTGGGVVFLFLVLFIGLNLGGYFILPFEIWTRDPALLEGSPFHKIEDMGDLARTISESELAQGAVKWFTGESETQVRYLLRSNPALLSVILVLYLFLIPLVAGLGSFNQTTGDIGSRGLRYLLLRTERANVFFGRFLGTTLFIVATTFILVSVVALYVGVKFGIYEGSHLLAWALQGVLALVLLSLPYVALCAWISAATETPAVSFIFCLLAVLGPPFLLFMIDHAVQQHDLSWTTRLLPWGWKYSPLAADVPKRLLASGVMLGFTVLFLAVGVWWFRRRDV